MKKDYIGSEQWAKSKLEWIFVIIFSGIQITTVFNVHLEELNCLLVCETSLLGVVLRERDSSDSPNN